jgi:group I intron endonuclease
MAAGVYLITCTANNRRYVGSSKNIDHRWREHRKCLRSGRHWNVLVQRSWDKYGADAFEWAVLEEVKDQTQLTAREQHWMDLLHPEFNLSPLAHRPTRKGRRTSAETRARQAAGNRRYWEGLSDEERAARGVKASHPHSEATRGRLAETTRQAFADGKLPRVKGPHSQATRDKIRAARARQAEQQRIVKEAKRASWEAGREAREAATREKRRQAQTGKTISQEQRARLREVARQQQADPDYRARHQAAVKDVMQTPEMRAKLSASHKGKTLPPEQRAKIGAAHKGKKRAPEVGEKIAAAQRARWARIRAAKEEEDA